MARVLECNWKMNYKSNEKLNRLFCLFIVLFFLLFSFQIGFENHFNNSILIKRAILQESCKWYQTANEALERKRRARRALELCSQPARQQLRPIVWHASEETGRRRAKKEPSQRQKSRSK